MAKRKKRVKRKARRPSTLSGLKKSIGNAERKVTKSIRHIKKHL